MVEMLDSPRRSATQPSLAQLLHTLRDTPAMRAKLGIQQPARIAARSAWPATTPAEYRYALPGDDTAAIKVGDHYHLIAIEGMLPGFVQAAPWFAGWSAVMANVSDIAAMGGRACAVVNAYWHHDHEAADQLLDGIRNACDRYGVTLSGGHTSHAPDNPAALAVAVIGIARRLLSTLHVAPGQTLVMISDLDGHWHADAPYWKAFEGKSGRHLRAQLDVLPRLAEAGLLKAAKDISNAGVLGTLLMLLEPNRCGASIDLDALPRPGDGELARWLQAFPSYGFLATLDEADWPQVRDAFAFEGLTCARIGRIEPGARLRVQQGDQQQDFWDLQRQPFTGFTAPLPPR